MQIDMPIPAGTVLTPAWHEDQGPEADRDHGSQNMLAAMDMAMPGAIGIAVSRLPASRKRIRQTAGMANASRRQRKALRSEERRGGQEGVSLGRSRGWPYKYKKKSIHECRNMV